MNQSYLANNIDELLDQTTPVVENIIDSGEIEQVATELGEKYKLSVGAYVPLTNVILFVLINALQPENVVRALIEIVSLTPDVAQKIAEDLEKGIFQKVRLAVLGKAPDPIVKLEFKKEGNDEELRKKLLDTTKRESALTKNQSSPDAKNQKTSVIAPGSRNQLLEQLQVLGTIPNDEEVESRLKHIQEQLAAIQAKEEKEEPDVKKVNAVVYNFGADGDRAVEAVKRTASYSVAPTAYNVDPYREMAED
jgi:hypothetical protein